MALSNIIHSEKQAIYTVHAAFEVLIQTRPEIKALTEPHFNDAF